MGPRRANGLEIDQDLPFVRRSWQVERGGWVGMAGVLVLALSGLLGSGPLSRQSVSVPGLLRVDYQRFARYQAPQILVVRVESAATGFPEARLWVDRQYLDDIKIETVTPPPAHVEAADGRLVYVFTISRPGEPVTIRFTLQSERIGAASGRIGLHGAEGVAQFRQFVYP